MRNNIFQFPLRRVTINRLIPAIKLQDVAKNKGLIIPTPYFATIGKEPAKKIVMMVKMIPSFSFFSKIITPIKIVVSVKQVLLLAPDY